MRTAVGAVAVLAGVALIVGRRGFARIVAGFQERGFRYEYGERQVRWTMAVAVIVGVTLIAFGIGAIVGVISFEQ